MMGVHSILTPEHAILAQCIGKDRLTAAQAHQMAQRPGKHFVPYLCPHCRQWHVANPTPKPLRRRKH